MKLDYQPLDLTSFYNASTKILGTYPNIGSQLYHGLPFEIGSDPERCFIEFGTDADTVSIPIQTTAYRIIVAHRLLESRVLEGDPVGRVIANYIFRYANDKQTVVPIRERFEINVIPTGWGQKPFAAWPDRKDSLYSRYEGAWESTGNRQTETSAGNAQDYYLWIWENPDPDREIVSIEIETLDQKFMISAITLGHLDEDPIPRSARSEVMISLPDAEDAANSFAMEIEVDRGIATYPYPLPDRSEENYMNSQHKGWGEEQNQKSSPSYVEISATSSATITVKNHGELLGQVKWGELEQKGQVTNARIKAEIVDSGRNWVHTTVVDDDTGKPIPCRIHFRSVKGIPYAPHGYHSHVNSDMGTWHIDNGGDVRLGQLSYAYIDGTCQGWLPRGEVIVDVARGFEYEPIRTKVSIEPGQRNLSLRIKRWCDMKNERYFSGDTHVHFLSTQGAHTEAQGEDLDVVNLLLSQWGHLFTNTEEFIGQPSVAHNGQSIVYATQENRQHVLGHLTLLGLKHPVDPWCSGGSNEAEHGGNLETTLSHWADACHSQGGTVILPHIPNPNCEPATLIATGRVDAVEYLTHAIYGHNEYYRYLNCGYKLPLVGGTDKMTSDVPVGLYRTYVHIPDDEEFNYDNWCKHLKAGNTFLSGGPIIRLTTDGQPIGSTVNLPGNGGMVEIEASCDSIFPIHTLEIVKNGQVVASTEEGEGAKALQLKTKLHVDRHSWIIARCGGPKYVQPTLHHDGWRRGIIAHTSPIYIAVGETWWMFDPETANYMLTLAEGGLSYIRTTARHYKSESVTHHHGETDHQAFLERPFMEAIETIHKRMHELGISH
ncbi:TPA: hypothetical protein EYN09_09125 [Candidatus Poribacteria bacterium]|nr:hypothetical protein [Candidatus Poribacteria bacterium]HIO07060.1 hypothetical protein [Candidatus Poribacteria bacterium]